MGGLIVVGVSSVAWAFESLYEWKLVRIDLLIVEPKGIVFRKPADLLISWKSADVLI